MASEEPKKNFRGTVQGYQEGEAREASPFSFDRPGVAAAGRAGDHLVWRAKLKGAGWFARWTTFRPHSSRPSP